MGGNEMNERVLDQRYKLEELIGSGGMADVYKATDMLLKRPVAVKILHDQFRSDTEFIKRFQKEAQAAARLSHPNIVNIYDVGVADDAHYIVMEYVPGTTLKDRIRAEGHLSEAEALNIAREIAEALASAHANNLVHCDIKPHNILMMPGGHIKVADFGIARAVTESTMTYSGNIVGSVHYISPEQARGTMITPRSDIYSLGVVLYEMLTGKLPFNGETPVSIAMKHLQEKPRSVRELNPSISLATAILVERAMSKESDMRPSGENLIQEIRRAQELLIKGAAGNEGVANAPDAEATQVLPRITNQPVASHTVPHGAYEEEERPAYKSKKFIIGLIAVLIMGFCVGAFMSYGKFWSSNEVVVPNVTGKPLALARQILEDQKLRVDVVEVFDTDTPAGQVVSQNPAAGAKVKEDRLVTIKVSKGGEDLEMPDLVGLSKSDAVAKVQKMGLKIGTIYEKYSDKEEGTVISQDPRSGAKLHRGDTVDITVSKGKETKSLMVPNVVGDSLEGAESTLRARGFKIGSVTKKESQERAGTVISQSPAAGEAEEGSSVSLVVSEQPEKSKEKTAPKDTHETTGDGTAPSQGNNKGKTK